MPSVPKKHECKHEGCARSFPYLSVLAKHTQTHTGKRPPREKCTVAGCDKTFRTASELKYHVDYVHENIYHNVCDHVDDNGEKCGYKSEHAHDLTKHKKKHNSKLKISCGCCERLFYDQSDLQHHLDYVAGIFHNLCDHVDKNGVMCGDTFEIAEVLEEHKKKKHKPELKIPCMCCTREFNSQRDLKNHVDYVAGIYHNVCDHVDENMETCGETYENPDSLAKHKKKKHNPELKIQCGCCTREFNYQSDLQHHVDYVAGIFHNVCDHVDKNGERCGKTYEMAQSLATHKKKHNPEPEHKCGHCDRRFDCQSELQNHVDYIAGIFNHICDHVDDNGVMCGKTCEQAGGLTVHKKVHNPELKLPCEHCTRRFNSHGALQNHVDFVNGIFHNACEYVDKNGEKCGKTCETTSELTSHRKLHIREAQRDMAPMEDHHVLETHHTVQSWERIDKVVW